jgi:uncharacterized membrane protein YkvA (DUF1232 family)
MSKITFEKILERTVKNYSGKYSEIVRQSPKIFVLVNDLLFDRNLNQKHRTMLLTSIGYFMLPQDLYPEDTLGPIGFIDDLMIILFVLREIKDEYGIDEIMMYWKSERELLENLLNEDFNLLLSENMALYNEVIQFVGF